MACVNCGKTKYYVEMPCEVCKQNDNDSSVKSVAWCDTCKAYICKKHEGQWIQRIEAAVRKAFKPIKKP